LATGARTFQRGIGTGCPVDELEQVVPATILLNKYSHEHQVWIDEVPFDHDFAAMNSTMTRKTRWCWSRKRALPHAIVYGGIVFS